MGNFPAGKQIQREGAGSILPMGRACVPHKARIRGEAFGGNEVMRVGSQEGINGLIGRDKTPCHVRKPGQIFLQEFNCAGTLILNFLELWEIHVCCSSCQIQPPKLTEKERQKSNNSELKREGSTEKDEAAGCRDPDLWAIGRSFPLP